MKLFASTENIKISFSEEVFLQHIENSKVISTENLFDFFYSIKDTFNNIANRITGKINDKVVLDITSSKYETLNKIKRIDFVKAKEYLVSKPENFEGKYIDYVTVLLNSAKVISEDTERTLNNLKLAIGGFINEYKDKKVMTLYGDTYFNKTEKLLESHRKDIASFFPHKNLNTKTTLNKVLKSLNDIEVLYKNIEIMDSILNATRLQFISKLTNECAELIDSLIELNTKNNILEKNNHVKKELIKAISISAREVEFLNYIYSNIYIFYGVFKNMIEELHRIEKIQNS